MDSADALPGKQIKPKELGLLRILLKRDLINSKIRFLKRF